MLKGSLLSLSIAWMLLWLTDDAAGKVQYNQNIDHRISMHIIWHILQRNWDYEPLSTECESSNEDLIKLESKVERVGRDEYALSGSLVVNFDMDETTMVSPIGISKVN